MPLSFEQYKALREKGLSNETIALFESGYQPPTPVPTVTRPSREGFLTQELKGGYQPTGTEGTFEGMGKEVLQSTIGSKGLLGVAQLPGKVVAQPLAVAAGAAETTAKGGVYQQTAKLLQAARSQTDPTKRQRLLDVANANIQTMRNLGQDVSALERYMTTPREALSTAANAALTVASGQGGTATKAARSTFGKIPVGVYEKAPSLLPAAEKIWTVGKGVVPRAVEQGFIGAGFQASSNLREGKPIGEGTTLAGIGGAAIPFAGTAVSKGIEKFVAARPEMAARVVNSLIKPLSRQFAYGKNPGRGVAREGIVFNSLEEGEQKIGQKVREIGQQINTEIKGNPNVALRVTDISDALVPLNKAINEALKSPRTNAGLIQRLTDIKKDLLQVVENPDGTITYGRDLKKILGGDLFDLKQEVSDLTKFTGNPSDDEATNAALRKIYGKISSRLEEMAPATKNLNDRYGDLKSAQIAIKNRNILEQRQNFLKLTPKVLGLGGVIAGLASGNWPAFFASLGAAGLDMIADTPAFKTRMAAWLAKANPAEKANVFRQAPYLKQVLDRIFGEKSSEQSTFKEISAKLPVGLSVKDVGSFTKVPKAVGPLRPKTSAAEFKGFTDLTTKTLEKLKGRTTVSKQFIADLTNTPDLKQTEREVIRRTLEDFPDTVNVADFANKVKTELLPLSIRPGGSSKMKSVSDYQYNPRYEHITLPEELRGPISEYKERVYQSPIQTSAGGVHFGSDTPNYFAHTRVEDLPAAQKTRRVIELQSDLFQKGRLENELPNVYRQEYEKTKQFADDARVLGPYGDTLTKEEALKQQASRLMPEAEKELSRLEPYRNTWQDRIIREEVKQAAKDGKTKLQFPTGETAMRIEGLGERNNWRFRQGTVNEPLTPDLLKSGVRISDGGQEWIITDVLGDGKFKAVPKRDLEVMNDKKLYDFAKRKDFVDEEGNLDHSIFSDGHFLKMLEDSPYAETFDISGKVDTENPIYKFYEKEVGKYLKNKYGATKITDPQGVTWWQVNVKPEMKKAPVEAFAIAAAPAAAAVPGATKRKEQP